MPPPPQHGHNTRSAIILYGTETGNSQDIAYELSQSLERLHFTTVTSEPDNTALRSLLQHDLVIFAISTTGQGEFPSNARKFWRNLLRNKLSSTSLRGVNYGLVGLCDSSYPKFNLAARRLHKRLQQLGASPLLAPCEADEQGEEGTEGAFLAWLPLLQEELLAQHPLENGKVPIPANERLPSLWTLTEATPTTNGNGLASHAIQEPASAVTAAASPEISFSVILEQNDRVTPSEHWQDVRFVKLRADNPVDYMPGDALAIRPQNLPKEVNQVIELLGWQDAADRLLKLRNNSTAPNSQQTFDTILSADQEFSLRQLLTEYLDINAIPRRSFFSKIAHFTDDEMQKERALEFTDPQYLDEYFDYATRPRRSIVEVLQEFHTVKIPWQEAINIFPVMRPRQFSIASGGALKQNGHVFELLIAIVKYRTVIKRVREGVCTKYLARLSVGTRLNVVLHTEGRFHAQVSDLRRPHLLIGGGTGIAPLRSIIYEKHELLDPQAQSVLFFGCRNAQSDYFFKDEWQELTAKPPGGGEAALCVITAFSRDQKAKVYVQDRIREQAGTIRDVLENPNSMIIVCGSSGAMPKAVRQALGDTLNIGLGPHLHEGHAEAILVDLEKSNRYKQETW